MIYECPECGVVGTWDEEEEPPVCPLCGDPCEPCEDEMELKKAASKTKDSEEGDGI